MVEGKLKIVRSNVRIFDVVNLERMLDEIEYSTEYQEIEFPKDKVKKAYKKRKFDTLGFLIEGLHSQFEEWQKRMLALLPSYSSLEEYGKVANLSSFIKDMKEEEYLTRKMSNGQKLGKTLKRMGASQAMLDYDGSHERNPEVKRYAFFINGSLEAVLNMSGFAKQGEWDGFRGTSCQDWRYDETYSRNLYGSLSCQSLYIGQLVELKDGEDLNTFSGCDYEVWEDRLTARINLFNVVEGSKLDNVMIPNVTRYGNSQTKPLLDEIVKLVSTVYPIFITEEEF